MMVQVVNIVMMFVLTRAFIKDEFKKFSVKFLTKFNSAVIKFPDGVMNIFFTGKAIITGIRDEKDGLRLMKEFLKKVKPKVDIVSSKIVNVTGCAALGFRPDCKRLCLHSDVTYEPELFPAIYYQRKNSKIVIMIFHTGKMVITGAKSKSQLDSALFNFREEMKSYIRVNSPKTNQTEYGVN